MGKLGQSRDRAVRLLTLAAALTQRPLTREQLTAELGMYAGKGEDAARQQFERDKRDLKAVGVTIEVDGPVHRVIGQTSPVFSADEQDALVAVAGLVADQATGTALAAFATRADAFPDPGVGARIVAGLPDAPELIEAVEGRRVVRFRYRGANAPPSDRHVEPWRLLPRRGLWYVLGFDLDRDEHRHFRLDRIEGAVTLDGAATHPVPAVLPTDLVPGEDGPVTVRVGERGRFDAERLGARPTDDPALLTFPSIRDEAALGFALRYDATIVEPPALERERSLRAAHVHDRHTLPTPEVPAELRAKEKGEGPLSGERLRRLLVLGPWLQQRPGITPAEVARGFACDEAELREDIGVLQDVVLPGLGDVVDVAIDENDQIVCRVELPTPLGLSPSDRGRVRSLLDAAGSVVAEEPVVVAGLDRLRRRLDGTVAATYDGAEVAADVRQLRMARDARRTVRFRYLDRDGSTVRDRHVTPTELANVDGHAYVIGWDHDRAAGRVFRVDRLARLELGDADPEPREVDEGVPRYVPAGDEVEVLLRTTHVGSWVLARLAPTRTLRTDDGASWAVVPTDTPRLVVDHVMAAAGEAEVVAPAELRGEIAARADACR